VCSLSGRNCAFKCESHKFRVSLSYDTCQISVSKLGNLKINTKNFEYYPNLARESVVKLFLFKTVLDEYSEMDLGEGDFENGDDFDHSNRSIS